jgi:diacylglycerol kinase family enzyme
MTRRKYYLLLNPNSGTVLSLGVTEESLGATFTAHGIDAVIDADPDTAFEERIARAIASDADVIVAAGGDGTATAIASAMIDSEKMLAVLPLGTANLLAKDLGLPLEIEEWVSTLDTMECHPIDVCEVNGTIFLHKAVIGVIPELAAGREKIRGEGFGAKFGFVLYSIRRLARSRRIALEVTTPDGGSRIERVQSIAVASNAYDEGLGRFFHRDKLDTGLLTLYTLRHLNLGDAIRLAVEMVAGRWKNDEALDIRSAKSVTIRSKRPRLQLMIDGEVTSLESPLHFKIYPSALNVLAPSQREAVEEVHEAEQVEQSA